MARTAVATGGNPDKRTEAEGRLRPVRPRTLADSFMAEANRIREGTPDFDGSRLPSSS